MTQLDDKAMMTRREILDSLQRIVTIDSSDKLFELDAVPREQLMDEVLKIRDLAYQLYVDAYAAGYDMRNLEVLGARMIETLFMLLAWHALADYPLQGDFLARAKNAATPIPGVPWWQALSAHSLIHSAGVYVITGSGWLAVGEFVAHFAIDHAKCTGRFGFDPETDFNIDQGAHFACKLLWATLA